MSWLLWIMLQCTWGCRYLWDSDFTFFKEIPRHRIAGSYSISIVNFLSILRAVFHSGCTNLHSHNSAQGFHLSPHFHQQLFSLVSFLSFSFFLLSFFLFFFFFLFSSFLPFFFLSFERERTSERHKRRGPRKKERERESQTGFAPSARAWCGAQSYETVM